MIRNQAANNKARDLKTGDMANKLDEMVEKVNSKKLLGLNGKNDCTPCCS